MHWTAQSVQGFDSNLVGFVRYGFGRLRWFVCFKIKFKTCFIVNTKIFSGVLWVHNNPIAGSPDVINKLKDLGKKVFFVTNNSTKTRTDFAAKAIQLGFNMKEVRFIMGILLLLRPQFVSSHLDRIPKNYHFLKEIPYSRRIKSL